jgi:hypothetical protein
MGTTTRIAERLRINLLMLASVRDGTPSSTELTLPRPSYAGTQK